MRDDGRRCNAIMIDAQRLLAMPGDEGDEARWLVIQDDAQRGRPQSVPLHIQSHRQ
jgi:hypothetical protein